MPRKRYIARLATAAAMAAVAVGGSLAGTASASTASTEAASSVTDFNITYGNTYFVGSVYWYDRSVTIVGSLRGQAASCRIVYTDAFDSTGKSRDHRNTSPVCNATIQETIPLSTPTVTGGPSMVEIRLDDVTPITLKFAHCTRVKCTIYNV